jgi:hypothetical protein
MSEFEEDIAEAIRIILWTAKGERVMRPEFGCGLQDYVFTTTDATSLRLLASDIEEAIRVWEPRVESAEVEVSPDEQDPGKLLIHIDYVVRSTNNLYNLVYPFYIHEGSN